METKTKNTPKEQKKLNYVTIIIICVILTVLGIGVYLLATNYSSTPHIHPAQWDYVSELSDGVIIARNGGLSYALDVEGNTLFNSSWVEIGEYNDGVAPAWDGEKWYCIDKENNKLAEVDCIDMKKFHDGVSVIYKDSAFGLVDTKGNLVIPADHQCISDSQDGMVIVRDEQYFAYNNKGIKLTEQGYEYAFATTEGGFAVLLKDGKQSAVNTEGKTVIEPGAYDSIIDFSDERFLVRKANLFIYLDKDGAEKLKLDSSVQDANIFIDGVAIIETSEGCCCIRKNGLRFGKVTDARIVAYRNNVLLCEADGGLYMYYNSNGKLISDASFDYAGAFRNGCAVVCTKIQEVDGTTTDSWSIIDKNANEILHLTESPYLTLDYNIRRDGLLTGVLRTYEDASGKMGYVYLESETKLQQLFNGIRDSFSQPFGN